MSVENILYLFCLSFVFIQIFIFNCHLWVQCTARIWILYGKCASYISLCYLKCLPKAKLIMTLFLLERVLLEVPSADVLLKYWIFFWLLFWSSYFCAMITWLTMQEERYCPNYGSSSGCESDSNSCASRKNGHLCPPPQVDYLSSVSVRPKKLLSEM